MEQLLLYSRLLLVSPCFSVWWAEEGVQVLPLCQCVREEGATVVHIKREAKQRDGVKFGVRVRVIVTEST